MAPIRFVLTLSLVCDWSFERPELRKHPGVGLEPIQNVAPALLGSEVRIKASEALSLVNPSLRYLASSGL